MPRRQRRHDAPERPGKVSPAAWVGLAVLGITSAVLVALALLR